MRTHRPGLPVSRVTAVDESEKKRQPRITCRLANLALMYTAGDGVPKDAKIAFDCTLKAAEWYRKAAEGGSISAQNEYGLLAKVEGVPVDHVQAFAWMSVAADARDSEARGQVPGCGAGQGGIGIGE